MKSSLGGRAQFKAIHGRAKTIAAEPASSSQIIGRLLAVLRKAIVGLAGSYRPEKHYMRGPGQHGSRCAHTKSAAVHLPTTSHKRKTLTAKGRSSANLTSHFGE